MLWAWRLSSVTSRCCLKTIPHNYHHSVFTTWKWHPFATWTPNRGNRISCVQNSRKMENRNSVNNSGISILCSKNSNKRLDVPAVAGLLALVPVVDNCRTKPTYLSITHPITRPMTSPMTSSEIPITQPYPDVIVYLRVRVRVKAKARVTREGHLRQRFS